MKKQAYSLSKEELRSFLVRYHSLDTYERFAGKAGIKKLFGRLGCVQYDPLNVVGRNPDLVFQSRVKNYSPGLLADLLYKERSLVDEFDKEMSIYLTTDWPNFSRMRRLRKEDTERVLKNRGQEEVLTYLPHIMEEIKKHGPLGARELKLGEIKKNRWGHRQVSGAALDYLYHTGELGVYNKTNTQKIYELRENLIPKKIYDAPDPFTTEDEFLEWYVCRRIGSLGAYWLRNGPGWLGYYLSDSALRQKTFKSLEEKKLIVPIEVPEIRETFFIRRKDLPLLNEKEQYDGTARILAPLDNMLWDRLMVKKIFDFEYTWEVYVPKEKRKYGYYVLPVLYNNALIARFEPVKQKKNEPLKINNWWWEASYITGNGKAKKQIHEAVKRGLECFARYLEAEGVEKKYLEN